MKGAEEWFSLVSEEGRADILKTRVIQEEETKRTKIKEVEATTRALANSSEFQTSRVVRIVGVCMVLASIAALGTCGTYYVSDHQREVALQKLKAEHPEAFKGPEAAPSMIPNPDYKK
jgi:hypothetical protein